MDSAVISCCDSAHRANSNANSSAVSMPLLCSPSLRYGERWRTAVMGRAPGWCWGLACSLRIDRAWPVRTRPDRAPAAWPTFARLAHANLESLRRAGLRSHRPFAYIGPSLPLRLLGGDCRSEEHTSELQSLMRISYAVFCLKKKKQNNEQNNHNTSQA